MGDMWDVVLGEVNNALPQFNKHTLRVIRQKAISSLAKSLDMVCGEAVKLFADGSVEYHGHHVLTPEECIAADIENQKYSTNVDVTRTETALTEFRFSHKGEKFSTQIYIPYLSEDAIIINGSRHYVMFALTDKVFYHIDKDHGLGIKVLRAHLRFWRNLGYSFYSTKGNIYRDHIIIAKMHWRAYKYSTDDIMTALLLYPLVQLGFHGTLTRFGIDLKDVTVCTREEPDDAEFEYFAIRPSENNKPGLYLKVSANILANWYDQSNRLTVQIIATLHYLLQYFVRCKDTIYQNNEELVEYLLNDPDKTVYQVILGKTNYGINYENEIQVAGHAKTHLESMRTYLDPETQCKLRRLGIECYDVYDLIYYVIEHLDEYVANYYPSNIYNKQLNITDLILGNMISSMFTKIYRLTNNRNSGRPYTTKEIASAFKIGSRVLSKIYQATGVIASSPSWYNDNWLLTVGGRKKRATFAVTGEGSKAKRSGKKRGGDTNLITNPAHRTHSSMFYVESASRTQTTDPTIGGMINPYCPFNEAGEIILEEYVKEILPLDQYIPSH